MKRKKKKLKKIKSTKSKKFRLKKSSKRRKKITKRKSRIKRIVKKKGKATCVEPNIEMLKQGKFKLRKFKDIEWLNSSAEYIPVKESSFDYYSISYGIRNVTDINATLQEAFRILKPGGRFMCLEFSKINNEILNSIYRQYSKVIPHIGKLIVGSEKPYKYLVESIEDFYSQEQLVELMKKNGFSNVEYRNVSNGISAIHSGWKI